MALACGQKRPRLSAGKALATDVEALPGGGRLSKVAARFGTLEKPGGVAEVVIRVPIPLFAIVDMPHWQNLRDPDGNDWDADCPASGVRRTCAPNIALWRWDTCYRVVPKGKIVRPSILFSNS